MPKPNPRSAIRTPHSATPPEGWTGWDEYAPFYDWENAQTVGRRDVPFWRRVAARSGGPVLELGCGTGRVSRPLARAGIDLVGIDRSAPMLERARRGNPQAAARPIERLRAAASTVEGRHARGAPTLRHAHGRPEPRRGMSPSKAAIRNPRFVRGDIRALPFETRSFATVIAPYGILQSL